MCPGLKEDGLTTAQTAERRWMARVMYQESHNILETVCLVVSAIGFIGVIVVYLSDIFRGK
jgi:hypothetical protein